MAAIEATARTQLGLFTAADAATGGLSKQLLSHHARRGGRWSRILPTVYQLTGLAPDPRRRLLAALLWAGAQAVLSHRSAGLVLRLDGIRPGPPELWAPKGRAVRGVLLHRGTVPSADVARTGILRHTSLLRTVRDLAAVLDDDALELVVESALRRDRHLPLSAESGASGESGESGETGEGGRNPTSLRRVLDRRPPGAPPTESELETRYLQVIRRTAVPTPVRQHPVVVDGICIGRPDVCWPEAGLWVELDGRAPHEHPAALLHDRHRQNELATRLQWLPLRFTWDDVTLHPGATARLTEETYRRRIRAG